MLFIPLLATIDFVFLYFRVYFAKFQQFHRFVSILRPLFAITVALILLSTSVAPSCFIVISDGFLSSQSPCVRSFFYLIRWSAMTFSHNSVQGLTRLLAFSIDPQYLFTLRPGGLTHSGQIALYPQPLFCLLRLP